MLLLGLKGLAQPPTGHTNIAALMVGQINMVSDNKITAWTFVWAKENIFNERLIIKTWVVVRLDSTVRDDSVHRL